MNNAFSGAHDIQNKLLKSNIITEDILLNRQRANVLSFFQEVRGNLKIISKRIDSVKPRLNEYIRNINRHDFYIRFKRFFNQLLEKSTLEKGKIRFPDGIPSIPIRYTQQPRFIIVKENFDGASLSRFKTAKSKIPVTNATETENRFLLEKERIEIQKRINLYMLDLENRLKAYQEVDFSAFFYEVLKKENGNIRICVKLAHKTMSKYYRDINSFGISISTENSWHPRISNDKNMEDDYLQENVGYAFLTTQEAISIFADVDYALKSGKHIQKCPSQGKQFAFVGKYYDKLKSYYDNLFDIHLNREGEGDLEYFFIDFFKDGNGYYQRGNIPVENREYLAESHLIIAFLLIRMYVLEPRAESRILIQDFKVQVLSEYEEYKPHLLRLFAKSEDTEETDYELKSIEDEMDKALKKFNDLCWIMIDKSTETFEIMPSLNRLLNMFENYIINTPISNE